MPKEWTIVHSFGCFANRMIRLVNVDMMKMAFSGTTFPKWNTKQADLLIHKKVSRVLQFNWYFLVFSTE